MIKERTSLDGYMSTADPDEIDGEGYIRCTSRFDGHDDHWLFLRFGLRAEAQKGAKTLEDAREQIKDPHVKQVIAEMIARNVTLAELVAYDETHLPHCVACIAVREQHGETDLPPVPALAGRKYPGTRERIIDQISGLAP